jgi:hypothetical protein
MLSNTASALRPEQHLREVALDVPNCSHQKKSDDTPVHTADWQLGKPYGRFDGDVRAAFLKNAAGCCIARSAMALRPNR